MSEFFSMSEFLAKLLPNAKWVQKWLLHCKNIKWKNDPPPKSQPYQPTPIEHSANILTHGLWVIPIVWYSYCLIESASSPRQYWAAWIYGIVSVGLFSVSTCFHTIASLGKNNIWRDLLHRGDRAMIYLFIAGSYTPWLTLKNYQPDGWANQLNWLIWIFACFGITYQQIFHEKYKWLETTIYLIVALCPGLAVLEMTDEVGVAELKQGGFIYLLGVIFFKLDGRVPLAHAIWHLHVVIASMIHFNAVAQYLIG